MKVLVCLPTRNEIESIETMIDSIKAIGLDLIVCDEHSTDGTIERAEAKGIQVFQRDGSGKGYGVQKAVEIAYAKGYEALVLIDCDCTYPAESIPGLLKFFPEYDLVIGRRNMEHICFSHRIVNILHTELINVLFMSNLSDINSGMRVIKVEKFKGLLDAEGFDIEAQITVRALKYGFNIKEVSIEYRKRAGSSKIKVQDTFTILKRIVKEKF